MNKKSSIISFPFHERLGIKSIANSHFYQYGSMHEKFTTNLLNMFELDIGAI
jgi:hypothetical protein